MEDIADLDIAGVAKAISSKSLSPIELTERMLKRISLVDPYLKAYSSFCPNKRDRQRRRQTPRSGAEGIAAPCTASRSPSRHYTTSRA